MTRDQLAVAAGVSPKTLERLESNKRSDATSQTLVGLSEALGVTVDYLLTGKP